MAKLHHGPRRVSIVSTAITRQAEPCSPVKHCILSRRYKIPCTPMILSRLDMNICHHWRGFVFMDIMANNTAQILCSHAWPQQEEGCCDYPTKSIDVCFNHVAQFVFHFSITQALQPYHHPLRTMISEKMPNSIIHETQINSVAALGYLSRVIFPSQL